MSQRPRMKMRRPQMKRGEMVVVREFMIKYYNIFYCNKQESILKIK